MKSYSSQEIIDILKADGWYYVDCVGSHQHYRHPVKRGKITVTHPKKNIPIGTTQKIFKQAGITDRK